MDFSAAQRKAEEYADTLISLVPAFSSLSKEAQVIERRRYFDEAEEAQSGCVTHFFRSGTRLKRNEAVIPADRVDAFDNYIRQLLSASTTEVGFDNIIITLKAELPRITDWLSWWLRPAIASMIFPAKSSMDPILAGKIPSSSNPIEHQHSLLHHAAGSDHDLQKGIHYIFLHVQEMEAQYNSIKGIQPLLIHGSLVHSSDGAM